MDSLLSNLTKNDVQLAPFPHLYCKNRLSDEVCTQLFNEFPPVEVIAKTSEWKSNQRYK